MQKVEIRLKGQINKSWSDWLGDLTIEHTGDGNTRLYGTIRDQAALFGLLAKLYELGFQLVYVSLGKASQPG